MIADRRGCLGITAWTQYQIFTAAENSVVVPHDTYQVGIACFGRGGHCTIPEKPHGTALGGGGGGAFAYGVLEVVPGDALSQFGVEDTHTYFHNFLIAGAGGNSDRHLGGTGGMATVLDSHGLMRDIAFYNGGRGGDGQVNEIFNHYSYGGGGGSGSFYGTGGDGGRGYTIEKKDHWRFPAECRFGHGGGGGWGGRGGGSLVGIDTPDKAMPFFGSQSGGGGGLHDGGAVMIPQGLKNYSIAQLATVPGGGGGAWGPGGDGSGPVINRRYSPGRGGPGCHQAHAGDWIDDFSQAEDEALVSFLTRQNGVVDTGIQDVSAINIYRGINGDGRTPMNPFLAAPAHKLDGAGGSGAQYFHAGHGGPGGGGAGRYVPRQNAPVIDTQPLAVAGHGGFGGGGGGGGNFGLNSDGTTYLVNGAGHGGPGGGGAGGGPGSQGGGGCIILYWS